MDRGRGWAEGVLALTHGGAMEGGRVFGQVDPILHQRHVAPMDEKICISRETEEHERRHGEVHGGSTRA